MPRLHLVSVHDLFLKKRGSLPLVALRILPSVVSVRVQLPAGAELRSTDGDWTVSGGVAALHAQLYRDLEASFVYTTDRPCR